jgi:hypothetical protein
MNKDTIKLAFLSPSVNDYVWFYLLFAFIFLRRKLDIKGRFSQVN